MTHLRDMDFPELSGDISLRLPSSLSLLLKHIWLRAPFANVMIDEMYLWTHSATEVELWLPELTNLSFVVFLPQT